MGATQVSDGVLRLDKVSTNSLIDVRFVTFSISLDAGKILWSAMFALQLWTVSLIAPDSFLT